MMKRFWEAEERGGRFADFSELKAAGLLDGEGLYIGAVRRWGRTYYLRDNSASNVLGVGPPRSGKGAGLAVPNLLSWRGSALVHDVKGELYELTASYRRDELGQRVVRVDPSSHDGTADRYNPFSQVRIGTDHEVADVQAICDLVMDPSGTQDAEHDHWLAVAADVLVGVALHCLYSEENASLGTMLDTLSSPGASLEDICNSMLETEHDPTFSLGWRHPVVGGPTATHPVVSGVAQGLRQRSDNEAASIISTCVRACRLYRDPIVRRGTEASDFDLADLGNPEKPMTIYLTTPPNEVERVRPLSRILLVQALRHLTSELGDLESGGIRDSARQTLVLLDEAALLGRSDFVQSALSFVTSYGCRMMLLYQSLEQIAVYGAAESIVSNCSVRVFFAPNKIQTAETVSAMLGREWVKRRSRSHSGPRFGFLLPHATESEQEFERAILPAAEVLQLPNDAELIFIPSSRPIRAERIRYFDDEEFARRAGIEQG